MISYLFTVKFFRSYIYLIFKYIPTVNKVLLITELWFNQLDNR
jgi:hypothetical protein